MTFAEVMDRVGLDATSRQYGEAFRDSKYALWHANASARKWLNRGIEPPMSGHPKYNLHANDIDFQIESDFIGLMTPGLPREANQFCERVGRVMNYGDGLYGGMFVTGMYAAAFFETDVRRIVEAGLAGIPRESGYARIVRDVLAWSAESPDDWERTWQLIEEKWNRDDPCPDGALRPFNIDARLNGAYIALGLLYGKGDFVEDRGDHDALRPGLGLQPVERRGRARRRCWATRRSRPSGRRASPAIADTKFDYTDYSFNDIVQVDADAGTGGHRARRRPRRLVIASRCRRRRRRPPPLEQWDPGVPDRVVPVSRGGVDVDRRRGATRCAGGGAPRSPASARREGRVGRGHVHRRRAWPSSARTRVTAGRADVLPGRPQGRRHRRVDPGAHQRQRSLAHRGPLSPARTRCASSCAAMPTRGRAGRV